MPTLSGSLTSFLKACVSKYSSKRRLNIVQSSKVNAEKMGWLSPMSRKSSTPNTSSLSKSTSGLSLSSSSSSSAGASAMLASSFSSASPLPSPSFFLASFAAAFAAAVAAFLASFALCWFCFACQACRAFCQSFNLLVNHSDGSRSSMRVVSLRSRTHCFKYSLHLSPLTQSKRTWSKPSSCSGIENFVKEVLSANGDMSGTGVFRNHRPLSSAVSSTLGGSSSTSISSSSCSSSDSFSSSASSSLLSSTSASSPFSALSFFFFSSSSFFFSASCFFLASFAAFFRSLSSCFCRFSWAFLRFTSACLALKSASEASCLSLSAKAWVFFLKSAGGSPIMTAAVRLKPVPAHLAASSFLSSFRRFPLTSMTT
mmetsp:Transcript_109435/g.349166  ORF Transcript_109435/g.349166 Transcript_109435/m.349166 type:complete len:370 (+) Transcript_109435:583-1692(+)